MGRSEDGRKQRSRVDRIKNQCTICGTQMGEDRASWGLVWASGDHGVCNSCLNQIRTLGKPIRSSGTARPSRDPS